MNYSRQILKAVLALALVACRSSYYRDFYRSTGFVDLDQGEVTVALLQEGEKPSIQTVHDAGRAAADAIRRGYIPIGSSSFMGEVKAEYDIENLAEENRATLVFYSKGYQSSETRTADVYLPNQNTSRTSGTITGDVNATYNSTTTQNTTQKYTLKNTSHYYNQNVVWLAKRKYKPRVGAWTATLSPEERSRLGRNTGLRVAYVLVDTPAFYSNVLEGDIITGINSVPVKGGEAYDALMASVPLSTPSVTFTLLRDGSEFEQVIELDTSWMPTTPMP